MSSVKPPLSSQSNVEQCSNGPPSMYSSRGKSRAADTELDNSSAGSLVGADDFVIGTEVADGGSVDCYQVFEEAMVSQGLSQLSRTASGGHPAFLRLDLSGTSLDHPDAIVHCSHLQHVNLSNNCLTTLKSLSKLQQLVYLDASRNQLTQVLDFSTSSSSSAGSSSASGESAAITRSSNLRSADLSYNLICQIRNVEGFTRLTKLALDGNQIEHIGGGLKQLQGLQHLSLSGNRISSCRGLEGLTSLRELALDGNRLASMVPLSSLKGLEVLLVAHNQLSSCEGIQGLSSLRRLDVSGNLLRRLEVLAAAAGLQLLGELDVAANPLEAAQNTRLHLIYLLPQVSLLNGAAVSSTEKVDAANMAGAAAEGLLAIRRQHFAAGELDDGGGAVPPTAAGLIPSRAEEESSCRDSVAMFEAIDAWARAIPPSIALLAANTAAVTAAEVQTAISNSDEALVPADPRSHSSSSSLRSSTAGTPRCSSAMRKTSANAATGAAGAAAAGTASAVAAGTARASSATSRTSVAGLDASTGAAAVAARLAAGCCKDEPWAQLQLARACYSWVVAHVQLPCGCSAEAGADAVTWDVGLHLFGEDEQQQLLHEALLPYHSGTWAECVSQLLVQLLRACHMEALQLSGFWKAGGRAGVGPGDRLAAHNHSWVAVKVNGRWRLLDPVYAIIREGQLPFYLPPEAFIHTHLPFEAYWQLLPNPVSLDQWWQLPEVSLAFCAAGGQLMAEELKSCTVLPAVRKGQPLPSLKIPVAAPATDHQYIQVQLLDHGRQLLASCQHKGSCSCAGGSVARHTIKQLSQQHHNSKQLAARAQKEQHQDNSLQMQPYQQQQEQWQNCLVYQQLELGRDGLRGAPVGLQHKQAALQELWVSPPAPGAYFVHVEVVQEVPGWLQLSVAGLQKPLDITYWQREDAIRLKVVVPPVLPHDPASGICVDPSTPVASLPLPEQGFSVCGGFQLLSPEPHKVLEADRSELFEVAMPAAAAVAVGCDELGWQELQAAGSTGAAASCCEDKTRRCSSSRSSNNVTVAGADNHSQLGLFRGMVVVPRSANCFVAAQFAGAVGQHWLPIVRLRVVPQVQHIVSLPPGPASLAEPDPSDPSLLRLRKMLAGLDVDGDGAASRRDMLLAFRRDRQLADHLKMPPRVKVGDGSFDKFLALFTTINTDGLGYVDLTQLAAYMASINSSSSSSSGCGEAPGTPGSRRTGSRGASVGAAGSGAGAGDSATAGGRSRGGSARSTLSAATGHIISSKYSTGSRAAAAAQLSS